MDDTNAGPAVEQQEPVIYLLDEVEKLISGAAPKREFVQNVENAIKIVLEYNRDDPAKCDLEIIKYARYMLAFAYMFSGFPSKADKHLSILRMRWRLSHLAFHQEGRNAKLELLPPDFPIHTWSDALPVEILSSLQYGFRPSSRFWSNNGYSDPDCPFFSFTYKLCEKPRTSIEQAVQSLRSLLKHQCPELDEAVLVEWWAHKRNTSQMWTTGVHALHFDTDEQTFAKDSETPLKHPLYSSVMYLSDCGGPTLVTNKEPGARGLGTAGATVWPEENRYLCFPGNLLHGVLPDCSTRNVQSSRLSLIIAWWGPGTRGRRHSTNRGPLQQVNPEDYIDSGSHWFHEFPTIIVPDTPSCTQPIMVNTDIHYISPIWEEIDCGDGNVDGPMIKDQEQTLPQLRIFVSSSNEFEEIYQEAAIQVYWERKLSAGPGESLE